MKLFASLVLLAVSANAAFLPRLYSIDYPTFNQFHSQDNLGQYSYGYNGALSSKTETKTLDGVTRGSYSYVDANGILQTTEYTADAINGFRAAATNLPRAPVDSNALPNLVRDTPEVAQARADHLNAYNRIIARPDHAEQYDIKPIQTRIVTPSAVAAAAPVLPAPTLLTSAPIITLGPAPGSFSYNYHAPGYAYSNGIAYQSLRPLSSFNVGQAAQPIFYPGTPFAGFARLADTIVPIRNFAEQYEQPKQIEETVEVAAARAEHLAAVEDQKEKIRAASTQ